VGGHYTVQGAISSGAMGTVHRALDDETGRFVAVKRLLDPTHVSRFEIEARLLAQLDHPRVVRVVDLKPPGSGEVARNLWSNIDALVPSDQIKFVLADRADYDWARDVMRTHALAARCEVLFSPVHAKLAPRELAEWMLADGVRARLQVQLHKLLWGEVPGH
jgi:7-carboxy-7-deazaguanine synthase